MTAERLWEHGAVPAPAASAPTDGRTPSSNPPPGDPDAPLREHLRFFFSRFSPRAMGSLAAVFVLARLALGGWRPADAVLLVVMVVGYPFYEWVVHRYVLHFQPRRVRGRVVDLAIAQNHRDHHVAPSDQDKRLPDSLRNMITGYGGITLVALVVFRDLRLALDGVAFFAVMTFAYEWGHYLMHTNHRPHTRWYRALRRHHLLHHFRNEHYWMGVLTRAADTVLRTAPDPRSVERSSTAREPDPTPV